MFKKRMIKDKRGDLLTPEIMFIIANLIFFLAIFSFIDTSSKGALAYEQAYAKQIALAIDSGKPFTQISIDFERGLEVTKEKTEGVISFNNNEVIVNLKGEGGYGYRYFSDYEVEHFFVGKELVLVLKEKQ
jgi:hypothetical protein